MTNQQKIDAILTAIRNTPGLEHLKEISFGCRVDITDKDNMPYSTGYYIDTEHIMMDGFHLGEFNPNARHTVSNSVHIIGHPVQWSDVLVVMRKPKHVVKGHYYLNEYGFVFHDDKDEAVAETDLTLNPEQNMQQDPELTDFLYELIVKE